MFAKTLQLFTEAHHDRNIQYAVGFQLAAKLNFTFLAASTFYQLAISTE